jgi:hypothetical protein
MWPLTIDVSDYVTALTDLTTALSTNIPTIAVAAFGIAAGLILLGIGIRVVRKFARG